MYVCLQLYSREVHRFSARVAYLCLYTCRLLRNEAHYCKHNSTESRHKRTSGDRRKRLPDLPWPELRQCRPYSLGSPNNCLRHTRRAYISSNTTQNGNPRRKGLAKLVLAGTRRDLSFVLAVRSLHHVLVTVTWHYRFRARQNIYYGEIIVGNRVGENGRPLRPCATASILDTHASNILSILPAEYFD